MEQLQQKREQNKQKSFPYFHGRFSLSTPSVFKKEKEKKTNCILYSNGNGNDNGNGNGDSTARKYIQLHLESINSTTHTHDTNRIQYIHIVIVSRNKRIFTE